MSVYGGLESGSVLTVERGSGPVGSRGAEVRGGGGADVQVPAVPHGLPRLRGVLCAQVQPLPLPVLRLVRTPEQIFRVLAVFSSCYPLVS